MCSKPLIGALFSRGDSNTHRVWRILINAAHYKRTVTYGELLSITGLSSFGMKGLFEALETVGEFERKSDRPWINGLVVGKTGKPGFGFFNWCKKYIPKERWSKLETEVYEETLEWCYQFWSDDDTYEKLRNENFL